SDPPPSGPARSRASAPLLILCTGPRTVGLAPAGRRSHAAARHATGSTAGGEPPAGTARRARAHLGRARPSDASTRTPARAAARRDGQPAARHGPAHRRGPFAAGRGSVAAQLPAPTSFALMRNSLSRLLAARNWTDGVLATRANLDRAYVNQVKNGRALPTVAT